jgi:hypothetical protein
MAKKKKELPQVQEEKGWSISIGLYPGILFGFRTYEEADWNTHVIYLPFIDIALELEK